MRSDRKWTHLSKLPAASNPWNSFIAPIEAGICWNLPLAITGTGKYQYGILDLLTVRCLEKSTWKTTIAHRTVAWLMVMNYHGWIRRKNHLKKTNASCVKYRLKHPRLPILKGHQKGVITPFTMVQSVKKHLTNPRIAWKLSLTRNQRMRHFVAWFPEFIGRPHKFGILVFENIPNLIKTL